MVGFDRQNPVAGLPKFDFGQGEETIVRSNKDSEVLVVVDSDKNVIMALDMAILTSGDDWLDRDELNNDIRMEAEFRGIKSPIVKRLIIDNEVLSRLSGVMIPITDLSDFTGGKSMSDYVTVEGD